MQDHLDKVYRDLVVFVRDELVKKINHRQINAVVGPNNKKRKVTKPWFLLAPSTSSQLSDTATRSIALQREGKDTSKENDIGETNTVRPSVYDYGKVPTISKFSGSTPVPKSESSFEDWKLEVESLIEMNMYPDIAIAQNIRRSLVG